MTFFVVIFFKFQILMVVTALTTQGALGGHVKQSELAGLLKVIDWLRPIQLSLTKHFLCKAGQAINWLETLIGNILLN